MWRAYWVSLASTSGQHYRSMLTQAVGALFTLAYSGAMSAAILWLVDLFVGLRATESQEREGLDRSLHGEAVE